MVHTRNLCPYLSEYDVSNMLLPAPEM